MKTKEIKNSRFILQQSETQANAWVSVDTENGLACEFMAGDFNITQVFTILGDGHSKKPEEYAQIANEMAEWLRENHYDKLFLKIRVVFGKNAKRLRNERGLTMKRLADLSGLPCSTIANIEGGHFSCNIDTQYKLSIGLNVKIRDLFDF